MSSKRLLLPILTHLARPSPHSSCLPRLGPSPHHHQPLLPGARRPYSNTTPTPNPAPTAKEPKSYTFEEVQNLSKKTPPSTLLIDVREPSELRSTGRIPGAVNLPLTSSPDAFWLGEEEFFERFGFRKPAPSPSTSTSATTVAKQEEGVKEVVFYCKAGVRSRAAARLAKGWEGDGVRVGEYKGSWVEWVGRGGEVER